MEKDATWTYRTVSDEDIWNVYEEHFYADKWIGKDLPRPKHDKTWAGAVAQEMQRLVSEKERLKRCFWEFRAASTVIGEERMVLVSMGRPVAAFAIQIGVDDRNLTAIDAKGKCVSAGHCLRILNDIAKHIYS